MTAKLRAIPTKKTESNAKGKSTFQVSNEEWERYGMEPWSFIESMDRLDIVQKSSAAYFIHETRVKLGNTFLGELTDENLGPGAWTEEDVREYEEAFKPFCAFIGLTRNDGEGEVRQIVYISLPACSTIEEGIRLFRSRLPKGAAR